MEERDSDNRPWWAVSNLKMAGDRNGWIDTSLQDCCHGPYCPNGDKCEELDK